MSYLTIVMVGSNEDYGGNFISRMQNSIDSIFKGAERHHLDADLLIVDWGTPPQNKSLFYSLSWVLASIPINLIKVPRSVTSTIPNPHKIRFFEPWAKSVGIRRATGDFILTTNADGIYSDELIARLSRKDLNPGCVYRVNRHDMDHCGRVYQIHRSNGAFRPEEAYLGVSRTPAKYKPNMPHFNAAGEFILMSRANYHAIRGWPELPYWAHVDSMVLQNALSMGLKQVVFDEPLYHQDHPRSDHPYAPRWSDAEPWGMENGEKWGFADQIFEIQRVGS